MYYFNKLSCYIMQEDLLRPNLTVFESMLIASHLKVGRELNEEDKIQSVRIYKLNIDEDFGSNCYFQLSSFEISLSESSKNTNT